MENIIIRKVNKNDIDVIVELSHRLYETEQQFSTNFKDGYFKTKYGRKKLLKDINNKEMIFLVAVYDSKVVGFINGYIYDNENLYIEKTAYLAHISVDDNYKRKGIATILMNSFEEELKNKNVKFIVLNAFFDNIPAVSLYKKNGYYEYSYTYRKEL